MTLDQLIVFLKIVDTGSYRKAAEDLYKSQPALTQSIKKLEEELDLLLFTRDTYRPSLTSAGTIFMKHARRAVEQMQALKVVGKELGMGNEGQVRIALDIICPAERIMQVANTILQAQSPYTELFISTEVLAGGRERLLSREVDIAIMPMHSSHPELMSEFLMNVDMTAVCTPDYMPNRQVTHERELRLYRQIVLSDSATKIEKLSKGIVPDALQWVVTDMHLKKSIITQGLGWGYLPEHLMMDELRAGHLVPIEIQGKSDKSIPISLIRHEGQALGPLTHAIWGALKGEFAEV